MNCVFTAGDGRMRAETLRAASVHCRISYFYSYWNNVSLPLFQSGEGVGV